MIVLAALVTVTAFAALCVVVWALFESRRKQLRQAKAQLARYEAFVDHLRETAWDHRELDPNLSTVIVDEIRKFTQSTRPEITK